MNRSEVIKLIGDNSIVSVEFVKADGSIRNLNGRMNVKKHLKGVGKKFDDAEYDLITIYDLKAKGYRSFKVSNLKSIKAHGREWKFG